MSEMWHYRMFGEEFGPVALDKLKEMALHGTIGSDDEVRSSRSTRWVSAGSVAELELSSGGVAVSVSSDSDANVGVISSQGRSVADEWYCLLNGVELGPVSFEEVVKFAEQEQLSADDEVKLGANGKWRRVGSIGRLVAVLPFRSAERQKTLQKSAAKKEAEPIVQAPVEPAKPDLSAAYQLAYEQAKAQIAQSMLAQAEAAFQSAEASAKAELAWASAPNVNPMWWGWMGGVEFGPVPFMQVFALAKNGQLKPADFIRNGPTGQYFPSSNAPGLFSAVATIAKAAEALNLAKAQAESAVALALAPATMPSQLISNIAATEKVGTKIEVAHDLAASRRSAESSTVAPQARKIEPAESSARNATPAVESSILETKVMDQVELERPNESKPASTSPSAPRSPVATPALEPRPAPLMSSSMSSIGSSPYARSQAIPSRPVTRPSVTSRQRSSSSFSEIIESLKEPKSLSIMAVCAGVLLCFGWFALPKSSASDIKAFRELKLIVDEIKSKRSSNSTDFASMNTKAEKVRKEVVSQLAKQASRDEPAKQHLLWAARDRMPAMLGELKRKPAEISKAEQGFIECLRQAARLLHIKDDGLPPAPPPPPEDPQQSGIDAN